MARFLLLNVPYGRRPTSLQTKEESRSGDAVEVILKFVLKSMCVPDATNEVQSAKARGKVLQQVPSAVQTLRKGYLFRKKKVTKSSHLFVTELLLTKGKIKA